MWWDAWRVPRPIANAPHLRELDRLLALGPAGGWCVSCEQAPIPPALHALGDLVRPSGGRQGACRFCLNFTRLLAYQPS